MKKQAGFTLPELLACVIILFATLGWVWNIIKLFDALNDPLSALIIFRMLGIPLVPVGVIMGYL